MKRWVLFGAVVILGLLSLGALGRAQGEDWGRGMRERFGHRQGSRMLAMLDNDRVRTALGLTDEQANQLRQIMVEAQKSALKTRADLGVRRIELRELMRGDQPDREAVMKKVEEISDLRGQMMKQRIDSLLAAKAILTPEQQKKIRAFMERRARGRSERGWFERRRPRRPMRPGVPPAPPAPEKPSDQ